MLNKVLLICLVLFFLNQRNKTYEGTINSNKREICGSGIKLYMFDERCSQDHEPRIIKNCIGAEDRFSKDSSCTLCNNNQYGQCRPSFKGGFCSKNGNKTDAYGNKIENTGRDITNMDEEEIKNLNEEEYNKIKNECNSFYSFDDDPEDDDYSEDDRDLDRLDQRYSHRRHRRNKRNRRNRRIEAEYEERLDTEIRRSKEDKGHYHLKDIFSFIGIIFFICFLIFTLSVIFCEFISNKTGYDLLFLKSIKNKIKNKIKNNDKNNDTN